MYGVRPAADLLGGCGRPLFPDYLRLCCCRNCLEEHCVQANCLQCDIGQWPDCRYAYIKQCGMEKAVKSEEDGESNG